MLGPAVDGGYYLIGFRTTTFTTSVFEDIPWGTQMVFQETLMKLKQTSHTVGLLPVWSDIDTMTDVKNLIHRAENTSFKSSKTMTYIRTHHIGLEGNNGEKSTT